MNVILYFLLTRKKEITYALVIYPVAKSLEELIPAKHSTSQVYSILIRTTFNKQSGNDSSHISNIIDTQNVIWVLNSIESDHQIRKKTNLLKTMAVVVVDWATATGELWAATGWRRSSVLQQDRWPGGRWRTRWECGYTLSAFFIRLG